MPKRKGHGLPARREHRVKSIKRTARAQGKKIVSGEADPSRGEVNPWAVEAAAQKKEAAKRARKRKKKR